VFDLVADERNNHDPTINRTALLTDEPIRVGTRFRCTSIRGRRTVDMIVEITGYDRPHRLRTTTHLTGMDITSDLRFESAGEDTLLRWASDLQPHGPLRLLTPAIAAVGRQQTAAIWSHLRTTLEHPAGSPPRPTNHQSDHPI
jgi:hypothetical protein